MPIYAQIFPKKYRSRARDTVRYYATSYTNMIHYYRCGINTELRPTAKSLRNTT